MYLSIFLGFKKFDWMLKKNEIMSRELTSQIIETHSLPLKSFLCSVVTHISTCNDGVDNICTFVGNSRSRVSALTAVLQIYIFVLIFRKLECSFSEISYHSCKIRLKGTCTSLS